MDYFAIGAAVVFAAFWAKGAEMENVSPLYWAGPSVLFSGIAMFGFRTGWIGVLVANLVLFAAITAWRMMKDQRGEK